MNHHDVYGYDHGHRSRPHPGARRRPSPMVSLLAGLALGFLVIMATNWIEDVQAGTPVAGIGFLVQQTADNIARIVDHVGSILG